MCACCCLSQAEWVQMTTWDLRGGQGAPTFGARGPTHHSQVDVVSLPSLVSGIRALAQEVGPVHSAVQALLLDPLDPRRMAFYLRNGWSGWGLTTCTTSPETP